MIPVEYSKKKPSHMGIGEASGYGRCLAAVDRAIDNLRIDAINSAKNVRVELIIKATGDLTIDEACEAGSYLHYNYPDIKEVSWQTVRDDSMGDIVRASIFTSSNDIGTDQ